MIGIALGKLDPKERKIKEEDRKNYENGLIVIKGHTLGKSGAWNGRSLAHEIGHILLQSGFHHKHLPEEDRVSQLDYLMYGEIGEYGTKLLEKSVMQIRNYIVNRWY